MVDACLVPDLCWVLGLLGEGVRGSFLSLIFLGHGESESQPGNGWDGWNRARNAREARTPGEHMQKHTLFHCTSVLCKCCIFYPLTRLITRFRIVVLEKTLQSPLASKEIEPVNPKGNQPWIFIGRTGAEAEATRLWSLDERSRLIGKDPNAGKDWGQEEKGMTEIEMVRWHHWLNGHEFGQTLGAGDGQGGWRAAIHGVAKSRTRLSNWTEPNW